MEESLAVPDLLLDIPSRESGWAHADDHLQPDFDPSTTFYKD